jgi:hypothetical protein
VSRASLLVRCSEAPQYCAASIADGLPCSVAPRVVLSASRRFQVTPLDAAALSSERGPARVASALAALGLASAPEPAPVLDVERPAGHSTHNLFLRDRKNKVHDATVVLPGRPVLFPSLLGDRPLWRPPADPVATMCCAVLCGAVLCCAVLCCAVLCCAVLCRTSSSSLPCGSPPM